jgi:molecular chaperone HtpG
MKITFEQGGYDMSHEIGNISIHTENILPIIKKWLYSEKDIFVRELVSNANDAVIKLKKLVSMGEAQLEENEKFRISVLINKDEKMIRFVDNGIGMTAEEVKKYINQIAFSGAVDFLEKYKDKADESSQIIGHFGLGFYSAFMVSEKVTIDTLSWQPGSEAVKWTSTGGTEFEMDDSDRTERGRLLRCILQMIHMNSSNTTDEGDPGKYCSFMPFEIFLVDEEEEAKKADKEKKTEDKKGEDKDEAAGNRRTSPSTILILSGSRLLRTVLKRNTRSFIKRCSMISTILFSGYI